ASVEPLTGPDMGSAHVCPHSAACHRGSALLGRAVEDRHFFLPGWVCFADRIVPDVSVTVDAVLNADGIATYPAPQPRRVVTRAVVVQSRFLVAFLPGKAIALQADFRDAAASLVGTVPMGVVFLVGNDRPVLIQFQHGGTEMVVVLVADQPRRH